MGDVKETPREAQLAIVAIAPKQAGEVRSRWDWAEPSVWTERMLTALENGVKGGVWFSLIDKVFSMGNLRAAWKRVASNKGAAGVDGQSTEDFAVNAEPNLKCLHEQLRSGQYRPRAVKRVWIPKPGTTKQRPLGIPTVRDRVVQTALRNVMEPIFEHRFVEHSYGFRPRRGCKDALRRVHELLQSGYTWVVDADIQSYFDTIPKQKLLGEVSTAVADRRVLGLVEHFLNQAVTEEMREWTPDKGTPQGAVISPLLANIYLHPVDVAMKAAGYEVVRYADDLVVLCRTQEEAQAALATLAEQMRERELTLHPDKTRIVDVMQGAFEFLGYRFERDRRWPREKSWKNLRAKVRDVTPRRSGRSFEEIIAKLNAILLGWFEYFKHGSARTFEIADGFARRRLRALLGKRRKKHRPKAFGSGKSHQIWPNAFFAERGLVSLAKAHLIARQAR